MHKACMPLLQAGTPADAGNLPLLQLTNCSSGSAACDMHCTAYSGRVNMTPYGPALTLSKSQRACCCYTIQQWTL